MRRIWETALWVVIRLKKTLKRKSLTYGIIAAGLLCVGAWFFLHQPGGEMNGLALAAEYSRAPSAKAAIVDHLSLSFPNQAFVEQCTAMLKAAGYAVEYYPGKEVTVELYRNLPTFGYDLILLRAHSAYIDEYQTLAIFSAEPYTKNRYLYDQLRNRVARGQVDNPPKGDPGCLAITDKFVRFSMKGTFDDAVVVMMGCAGIRGGAKAFLEKGARAYIGWDGRVSAHHTDRATIRLLERLLVDKQTIRDAVAQTMKDVGQEPKYKSLLLFWPIKAGQYAVPAPQSSIAEGHREQGRQQEQMR